jgi:hypothetical protein
MLRLGMCGGGRFGRESVTVRERENDRERERDY